MKAMRKRQRRKLEKKRKAKRERSLAARPLVQAYTGQKYRRAELVPLHMATERGILEAYVITDRSCTDDDVCRVLAGLVQDVRAGQLRDLTDYSPAERTTFGIDELMAARIYDNWQLLFAREGAPDRNTLVGVLRTILGSVDVWRTPGRNSQGYLEYLEDFLGEIGVSVVPLTKDEARRLGLE